MTLLIPAQATRLRADVFANVTEANADGYELVYTLPIPNMANFRNANAVPYSFDIGSTKGAHQKFDRIAYYMELDAGAGLQWVYASMDAFTSQANQIGLPHNVNNPVIWQQIVNNMNVDSNAAGIVTGTGIATGNVEFWSTNYNQSNAIGIPGANGGTFDFGDGGAGVGTGHGSFQIHNHGAAQTLFGYSDWGGNNAGANSELGIGTNTGTVVTGGGPVGVGGNPDWTFADSAHLYSTKNLQVLVRPTALEQAPTNIVSNAPEANTFTVVYQLPVQSASFNASQYAIDNSLAYPDGSIERLAYYLELDTGSGTQFAYVSMDPFTTDASQTGVPNNVVFEQTVDNLNVISNVAGVVNGEDITTGNIEFWGTNYGGTADSGLGGAGSFDFDDTRSGGGNYGSMQIHNYGDGQTIFAYNRWGGGNGELGIGNQSSGNPDCTFADNSGSYTVKNIWVLADIAGEELTVTPGTGSTIDFGEFDMTNTGATLTDAIALQNTGVINSIIAINDFDISGADAALFDVPDFTATLLQAGFDDTIMYDVEFLGAPQGGDFSATLTFDSSTGPIAFDLAAAVSVPEPATVAIWLLLGGLAMVGYRCRQRNQA